ncbi:MAG: 4-alpha-glucanotransferase [Candidatus Tumulicola sp.]
MSDALERLAELAGIAPAFHDYFGNETVVSDATKAALLHAMGYDAGSEEAVATSLQQAQDEPWLSMVPPAAVLPAGDIVEIACTLPHETAATELSWTLVLEDGDGHSGSTTWQHASPLGERVIGNRHFERRNIRFETPLPLGYHRLSLRGGNAEGCVWVIAVPPACFVPPAMERGRIWALATQLYALKSNRNWGIGDFSDLAKLATVAAAAGAGAIALNPLHELYPSNPRAASPYAPSSRLFLNAMYVDIGAVADLAESPAARACIETAEFGRTLQTLRDADLVDYAGVAHAKLAVLELLFTAFRRNHLERPGDRRATAFRAFVRTGGAALARLALYETLAEHFRARDANSYGWLQWPAAYRSPESEGAVRFAREHRERVDFYCYLQWLADEQLGRAAATAHAHSIGLYRDLAVGVDRNGADVWSDPAAIALGASLGAPADPLNTNGQDWGLPPLSPRALRARSYAPFVELVRANMRHARILRIDHVMALRRAFWIPQGRPATEGAYVNYPFEELLGILELESVRNGCAVVGEDLGTVPDGFRERLQDARALSSRLVYFEREWDGAFRAPSAYPRIAAASIGTHDLPPLLGWWTSDSNDDVRHARFKLVDALEHAGCADAAVAQRLRDDASAGGTPAVAEELSLAVHRFLARTPSMLAIVAIEDVLDEVGAVNVPGTVDEHPNWRRKRSLTVEGLANDGRLFRIGAIMCDTAMMTSQREAS